MMLGGWAFRWIRTHIPSGATILELGTGTEVLAKRCSLFRCDVPILLDDTNRPARAEAARRHCDSPGLRVGGVLRRREAVLGGDAGSN